MIPRIVYQIWISDKEMPTNHREFVDKWKLFLPDYDLRHITLDNMPRDEFIDKLLTEKKYMLINHYLRYKLLYDTGGLYFDSDIEVIKSFDDLLDRDFLIAREDLNWINNAVMGCSANNELMGKFVKEMQTMNLDIPNVELATGPRLVTKVIKDNYLEDVVLPPVYFYPYHYSEEFTLGCIKLNTYAIHHWNHTWKN